MKSWDGTHLVVLNPSTNRIPLRSPHVPNHPVSQPTPHRRSSPPPSPKHHSRQQPSHPPPRRHVHLIERPNRKSHDFAPLLAYPEGSEDGREVEEDEEEEDRGEDDVAYDED